MDHELREWHRYTSSHRGERRIPASCLFCVLKTSYKLDYSDEATTQWRETWNIPSTKVSLRWTLVVLDIFVMRPFDAGPLLTSAIPECATTTISTSYDRITAKLMTYNLRSKDYKP